MLELPKITPTSEDWAYLAGLIDGEGCVVLHWKVYQTKTGSYRALCGRVEVANTYEAVMPWIKDRFGGTFCKRNRYENPKCKPCYKWTASRNTAFSVLQNCLPYMVIKRDQALLFLEATEEQARNKKKRKLTPEEVERREKWVERMRGLNKKGVAGVGSESSEICSSSP